MRWGWLKVGVVRTRGHLEHAEGYVLLSTTFLVVLENKKGEDRTHGRIPTSRERRMDSWNLHESPEDIFRFLISSDNQRE